MKNLIILDDFYENPDAIRNIALNSKYLKFKEDQNYPGYESIQPFYAEEHAKRFESLIDKPIYTDPDRYVYGKFRYSPSGAKSYSDVHIDSPHWSAMIYLSLDKDCKGGLGLYRHKETGIFEVPSSQQEFEELGYKGFFDFDAKIVRPDTFDPDAWELVELIPIKYNRLVLFKGSTYFHSITEKFGDNIENARLTHSFFFNEKIKVKN